MVVRQLVTTDQKQGLGLVCDPPDPTPPHQPTDEDCNRVCEEDVPQHINTSKQQMGMRDRLLEYEQELGWQEQNGNN